MSTKPTMPGPLNRAPRRIRPPFDTDTYDPVDHQRADETLQEWRDRRLGLRVAALLAPLDGIDLGTHDDRVITWLAG